MYNLPGTREASASALKDPGGCLTQIPRRRHRPNGAWRARVCWCGLVGWWVGVPNIPECEQGVGCHKHTVYIVHSRRRTSR